MTLKPQPALLERARIAELTDRALFETLAAAYVLISELRAEAATRRLSFFSEAPILTPIVSPPGPLVPPPPPANSKIRKP